MTDIPPCTNLKELRDRSYTNGGILVVKCRDCGEIKGRKCPACNTELTVMESVGQDGFVCDGCGTQYFHKG